MSRAIEIESKSALTKEEYELILSSFPNQKPYVQTNYYIDTNKFSIRLKKAGLRVREKEGKFELTLKVSLNEGKLEINQDITKNNFDLLVNCGDFPSGEIKDYLINILGIKLENLFIFTSMETTRLDINYKGSLISIDKSICLDETDYEIECESTSLKKAEKLTSKFLKQFGLKYKKFSSSKLRRAIERYKARQ